MDNLQQYFRQNSGSIKESDELIPEGDESRFEQRWEYSSRNRIHFRSNLKRRRKPLWKVIAFPLVASLALIFGVRALMNPYIREEEPRVQIAEEKSFSEEQDTLSPGYIYQQYCRTVADITLEVAVLTAYMPEDWAEEAMAVVDDIVREPVPLIDQLEGVDTQRQREILQEYSARQIAALDHVVGTIRGLNETE